MNTLEIDKNISILFKATRKYNGLLQSEFANILGVTQGTVSKIEAGTMIPDLSIWFKLLRSFKILDPYCFTYSGLEYNEDVFNLLRTNGSKLAPKFDFKEDKYISNVRKVRPLFDYLQTKNTKVLDRFLEDQSVSSEIFYILNHPLTSGFVDTFFSYLDESKINAKSIALMDLDFHNSLGRNIEEINNSQNNLELYKILNSNTHDLFDYESSKNKNEYFVSLNKKNANLFKGLEKCSFILNYNLLYPFHAIKSLKGAGASSPEIFEMKEDQRWRIVYAS
jgi:DNA-binding XRE family transcriptional regulator